MLNQPPLDELLPKTENRYTLAVLVAKRARQLVDGAQPMIETDTPNLVTLASEEVAASTIVGVPGEHNPVVPIRPEIEAQRMAAERDLDNDMTFDLLQQVQPAEPAVEEEPQPRASMIKVLGEDGEIYEQDEAGVSTSLIEEEETDGLEDEGAPISEDTELDDNTAVTDEGTLREAPEFDHYDDESDADEGLDEDAAEEIDDLMDDTSVLDEDSEDN